MDKVKEMLDVHKYYDPGRSVEPKVKRDWKKKYVDFCIAEMPGPGIVKNDNLKPGVTYAFDYIDDDYLMFDRSPNKRLYLYWGGGFLASFVFFIWYVFFPIKGDEPILLLLIPTIMFLLPAIWQFILAFAQTKEQKVIFDRQRGLVQVPGSFWQRPQLIRFNELHAVMSMMSRFGGGGMFVVLRKNRTFADKYLDNSILMPFFSGRALQLWSFWVWYMDKNRPLPFGEALDPYRQRDYERRKAEGFPEPLYPSLIKTPEHFTDEYRYMNALNKQVKGRYGMSLNDDAKLEAEKRGETFWEEDPDDYYNSEPN